MGDAPLEHLGGEVIAVAQIGEADNEVLGFTVLHQGYSWYHLNAQTLCQEGTLLSIHLAEFGLDMLGSEYFQVHVHNATALGAVSVEVAHNVGRFLGYFEKLLLVGQLCIRSVALKWVYNLVLRNIPQQPNTYVRYLHFLSIPAFYCLASSSLVSVSRAMLSSLPCPSCPSDRTLDPAAVQSPAQQQTIDFPIFAPCLPLLCSCVGALASWGHN